MVDEIRRFPGHITCERSFMNTEENAVQKSSAPTWLGWIGAVTTALGLFLLLRPINNCGSVFAPDLGTSRVVDAFAGTTSSTRRCIEQLDAATVPAWVIACAGLLLIIAAIIVSVMTNRQPTLAAVPAADKPSLAEELEKLAALKNSGAITEAEFERSKASILGRRKR